MNHIYKTIWNASINSWVAGSELCSKNKNSKINSLNSKSFKPNKLSKIFILSFIFSACTTSFAQSIVFSGDTAPSSSLTSPYTTTGSVTVGRTSTGFLDINNGGALSVGTFTIGNSNGSVGTVSIDGNGSSLTVTNAPIPQNRYLHIGTNGKGTLNVTDGAKVTVGTANSEVRIVIGYYNDGDGTLNISGLGSTVTVLDGYIMVAAGAGNVNITNGGLLKTVGGYIGQEHNKNNAIYTVTDATSKWESTGTIYIDSAGSSQLFINNKGVVDATSLYLGTITPGNNSLGTIDVYVSDLDSELNISGELRINRGNVSISSQGQMETTTASIGSSGGSNSNASTRAVVSVDGSDSKWNNTNNISMGGGLGQSILNITSGGKVTSASLSMDGSGQNSITINGSTSSLTLSGNLNSNTGNINVIDAGALISDTATIGSTTPSGLSSSVTVSGANSSWINTSSITLGGGSGNSILTTRNFGEITSSSINANQNSRITGDSKIISNITLNSESTIAPHSETLSYATLNIKGDLIFNSGSTYEVSGDSDSNLNDLIQVDGNADISNGNLLITAGGTSYQLGTYYTVLETINGGTLSGTFKNVDANYEFLNAAVDYSITNQVRIGLARNNVNLVEVALTPNQKSTATALNALNESGILDEYISTIPKGSAPAAFDAVSGEIHATLRSSLLSWSQNTSQSSLDQLRYRLTAAPNGCSTKNQRIEKKPLQPLSSCDDHKALAGWAQVVGNWNQMNSDGNAAKSKSNTGGLLLGTDYSLGDSGWHIGGMFGYGKSTVKSNARRSSADLQNYTLGVHAGKRFDWGASNHLNIMGGLSYTHHSIKTDRLIPRVDQRLEAKYSSNTVQAFGEVGYAIAPIGEWKLEPFVGLNVAKQKVGHFQETGGFAGVHSNAESKTYTTAMFGVHAQSNLDVSGKPMQVRGTLGLKQALGNKEVTRTMAFNQGSPDYLIWGVPRSSSTLVLGLQAQMVLSPNATLEAGFNGEFGKNVREQAIQARVRWAF